MSDTEFHSSISHIFVDLAYVFEICGGDTPQTYVAISTEAINRCS
jgi:hypothetical protein